VGLQPHETPPTRPSKNQVRGEAAPKHRRVRNRPAPRPSHAQRSPQADFPGIFLFRPAWLSDRSPLRGRNTLAPVVRLGMTERPRVSARLSGRKNHRVQITFVLYQALAGRSGINPRQPHPPQPTEGAWGFSPTKPRPPVLQRVKFAAKPASPAAHLQ
jgi:hypothetical protein